MLNSLSHFDLQQYWWLIMSLVGSILVFLLFVQGGQSLISTLGKTADERNMVVNSIGRKWEFTFTTLILFAAGMFAAFPLFYSTSFGGAYYAWKLFLIVFVIQAVSFEFRRKKGNLLGTKTYDSHQWVCSPVLTRCCGSHILYRKCFYSQRIQFIFLANRIVWH